MDSRYLHPHNWYGLFGHWVYEGTWRMRTWAAYIAMSFLGIFAPAKDLFIAVGILIVADLVTGIMAAYKEGKPITSAAIRRTVSKMVVYNIAVGSGFLVQHYLMADLMPVSSIVSSAIGLAELKSILENLDKVNGGSVVKSIILRLGSVNDNNVK